MTILETRCEINLQWAKWASRKTRTILHRGPANRPYRPEHESLFEYADLRLCVHDVKSQTGSLGPSGWEKHIADAAELATRHHCGNCGEHAAVAFMLLKDENVRPLDFVGMSVTERNWSHNFVVIGRERHRQRPLRPGSTEEVIKRIRSHGVPTPSCAIPTTTPASRHTNSHRCDRRILACAFRTFG